MNLTPQQLVAKAKAKIKEIDIATAAQHIDASKRIVDVCEPAEFEAASLQGAVNILRGVLEFKIGEHPALANKAAEILLYCKTGGRSALATLNLQRLGYSNVCSLSGWFDAWVCQRHAVAKNTIAFGG